MPKGITTFNDIPPAIREIYQRKMLEEGQQTLAYRLFVDKDSIPTGNGDGMEWFRYDDYPIVDTELTDGVYGAPRQPVRRTIKARLSTYGDWGKYTKKMVRTNLEDFTQIQIGKFARQSSKTFDALMREVYYSGISAVNATNGVAGTPGTLTEVTAKDFAIVAKALRSNEAEYITPMMKGSTIVGSGAVSPSYFAIVHTDLRDDIRNMGTDVFLDVKNYGANKTPYPMELGTVDNIRILETPYGKLVGSTYSITVVAANSAGEVSLSGSDYNVYRHGFGSGGSSDPHSMFMTVGWDAEWTGVIKNDNWVCQLNCIHS